MKATDLDLSRDIRYSLSTGITSFQGDRLLIFDANAIGLLRHLMMEQIGASKTREILTRFGYQNGYADFFRAKLAYQFDDEMNLLASGPVIHTWEGIVKATPTEIRFDRMTGDMYFTGVWENSYESEQYLCYHGISADAVCWSLTGYASGWTTAFLGKPVLAMEPLCRAKGDPNCGWLIQPPNKFGPEARPFVEALKDFWEAV